jgi:cellulose synthase/poly-beta-1,6-N-acetylglucosamine synthase-like glycosyltransferase
LPPAWPDVCRRLSSKSQHLPSWWRLNLTGAPARIWRQAWSDGRIPPAELPVYSVLVALYHEAEVAPELVAALEKIDWPKSKLEIKLVCEADDHATLGALRALALPRNMEVVAVPVFGPRTKPKALAYALPLVSGEFVALYDAEDHPHPKQLLTAWQRFREAPHEVACIQAPLEIANRGAGIVARMFAFEYAALFRGMLPWLSARRLLLPLGGTSNHFCRAALEEVGGWDPYNVTEDADLGMRLARFGYRAETIACPTYESGPDTTRPGCRSARAGSRAGCALERFALSY